MLFQRSHLLFKRTFGKGMKNTMFIVTMRAVVCMLNFCPIYVVNTGMIDWMQPEMDSTICKLLLNFFCGMALISYWVACLKKPRPIP